LHGIGPPPPSRRFRFSRQGEKAATFKKRSPRTTINWDLYASLAGLWGDAVMNNVDEEYDRFLHHLHDSAKEAESLKTTKRRLSPETLVLIRQRGAARASGNYQLRSELAKLCREAIKEDLKERRAEVLAEAAEAGLSIRNARRDFANFKTKMTALPRPDGTVTSSRRTMEMIIHDFYSDLFYSHFHLPHAIFRRMDTSSPLFSLPRSDTPSMDERINRYPLSGFRGVLAYPFCCSLSGDFGPDNEQLIS
ncbi:unnamed protein product, partial [Heligmosomoides polygyrus]|uniref:Cilia- and flagella-associated protein 299 n=1 Tax=Heligmosomoides polygyrus TaxID=6339 RepID=A0A183GXI9_HELPZ